MGVTTPKTVELDIERQVMLNLFAMKKFRELTGKSVMHLKEEETTEEEVSALAWAALLTYNPDITQEEVDKMVHVGNLSEVYAAIMETSMTPEDRKKPKNK